MPTTIAASTGNRSRQQTAISTNPTERPANCALL
jgi:hypothetical protein